MSKNEICPNCKSLPFNKTRPIGIKNKKLDMIIGICGNCGIILKYKDSFEINIEFEKNTNQNSICCVHCGLIYNNPKIEQICIGYEQNSQKGNKKYKKYEHGNELIKDLIYFKCDSCDQEMVFYKNKHIL